ncbi:hypothetical protein ACA910_014091 [Epithemia clementina (nom. ined.)]
MDQSTSRSRRNARNNGRNHGGGRATSRRMRKVEPKKKNQGPMFFILFLLLMALIFNLIFRGQSIGDSPSMYFYQSSYFETQMYKPDGNVDTVRKQSIRTNFPSIQQDKSSGSLDYTARPDEEFELELNDEIDSMMRFQRSMFDKFF